MTGKVNTTGTDENLFRLVPVLGKGAQVLPLELVPVPGHGAQISTRAPTTDRQQAMFRLVPGHGYRTRVLNGRCSHSPVPSTKNVIHNQEKVLTIERSAANLELVHQQRVRSKYIGH